MVSLNNKRVLISLIDSYSGAVQAMFTYNEKGPLIYVKSLIDKININNELF